MAYFGSTAASSVANPPRQLLSAGFSGLPASTGLLPQAALGAANAQGGSVWYYCSTNTTAEVVASNFFTDGKALGMRPGDLVMGVGFATSGTSGVPWLGCVSHVSTSGASLTTVLAV
ncbi:MAG: hypothetical protein E6Q24_14730 [Chitinophagaceae bacterium]|nr:MAG: hypothetical protein E6Q24_14730 [Chitinophagaceae bacterium]